MWPLYSFHGARNVAEMRTKHRCEHNAASKIQSQVRGAMTRAKSTATEAEKSLHRPIKCVPSARRARLCDDIVSRTSFLSPHLTA